MINLSQRDPRWAETNLGSSLLKMKDHGCTTTAESMLSDFFKGYMPPNVIAEHKNWYTPNGLRLWANADFPTMKWVWRQKGFDKEKINASLKDPKKAVILQVNNGKHWVVAIRKTIFGNDYVCVDPWDGKKKDVFKTYKNITGSSHYEAK